MSTDGTIETYEGRYPSMKELFPRAGGGWPGFLYGYITPESLERAQNEGCSQLEGGTGFRVIGPKGECFLIPVGVGKPVPGLDVGQVRCEVRVDPKAEELTGIAIDEVALAEAAGVVESKNGSAEA